MKKFAGTFHQNVGGDWVKCITEGGKPCSLHAGGEHIKGADLETALAAMHEDDDFGMSAVVDNDGVIPPTLSQPHAHPHDGNMGHAATDFKHDLGSPTPSGGTIDEPGEKPAPKKKKVALKKTGKPAVVSKHEVSSVEDSHYDPSSIVVDPVKHQEQLEAMIEEEKHYYHTSWEKPHKAAKGISEYKTLKAREHHFQELMGDIDSRHPINITSRPEYHYDTSATIHSVADTLFPGVEKSYDIEKKLARQSTAAWKKITATEQVDIKNFTGSSFGTINGNLIGKKSVAEVDTAIDNIHHGLSKSKTKQDMILYRRRYMSSDKGSRSGEEKAYYQALANNDGMMSKPNFSSTTVVPSAVGLDHTKANDTVYVIKVPKGTPGMYLGNKSLYKSEHEFLLDKGLTYKVVGVYERGKLGKNSSGDESWTTGKAPIIALEIIPSKKPTKKTTSAKESKNTNTNE